MVFAPFFLHGSSTFFRFGAGTIVSIAFATLAHAQWSSVPGTNTPIVTNPAIYPQNITMIADGAGGTILVWSDARAGVNDTNLYAQRLDANGARQWGDNGTPVCDLPGNIQEVTAIADGAGGAFLAWKDERPINGSSTKHLYLQRLNAAGQAQWGTHGKLLRENGLFGGTGTAGQSLFLDGTGGVYVFSGPDQSSANLTRRLHRFNGAGQPASGWTAEGVDLQVPSAFHPFLFVSDQPANATGERGVVLGLNSGGGGISLRHVRANGSLGFTTSINTFAGLYHFQAGCSDGAGGMFVITGGNADLFVFRVKADGTMAWPETNRRLVDSGGFVGSGLTPLSAFPDGAGGMIATFFGPPQGTTAYRMVAQRISSTGQKLWGANGVDVYPPNNNSYAGASISDGAGGAIIVWGVASPGQVRAQRLDANGNKLWPDAGVLIAEPYGQMQLVTDNAHGAIYSVLVNQGAGASWSFGAKHTFASGSLGTNVPPPAVARLVNLAARAQVGSESDVLIPGFVISGGPVQLLVRGIGPTLADFGVNGALTDPQLTLFNAANQATATNDDWALASNAAQIASMSTQVSAFPLANAAKDAAMLVTLQPGLYTAVMSGKNAATGIGLVELYETGASGGRLANLSVRARVGTDANMLIPGIVIGGNGTRTLLIRAIGPTLTDFGVSGVLADPQVTLFDGNRASIATNDNWSANNAAQIATAAVQVGAFALPNGSKDAVLLVTLGTGSYTAQLSGVGGTSGVALVEVYEVP